MSKQRRSKALAERLLRIQKSKPKESSIQKAVISFARDENCVCIKQGGAGPFGSAGWPDYLVLFNKRAMFIEFKREGGKLTVLQEQRRAQIDEVGIPYHVVSDVPSGRSIILDFCLVEPARY